MRAAASSPLSVEADSRGKDEIRTVAHRRHPGGKWEMDCLPGPKTILAIASLGISIPFAEINAGIPDAATG